MITGGTGVLGGAVASHLLEAGAIVAVIGSRQESVDKKLSDLQSHGDRILGVPADCTDENAVKRTADQIFQRHGRVDALINAAGGNLPGATIAPDQTVFDIDISALRRVMDLNLMGSVIPSLIFGELMAKVGQGSIVNISSMAADRAITRVFGYSMAKSGIEALTKWMAMELAQKFGDGLRVNAIAPGFFIGNQNRRLLTEEDGSFTTRGNTIITNTPMARFGDITELNGIVQFLCSDASSFTTGTIIPIDGGFSIFSGV